MRRASGTAWKAPVGGPQVDGSERWRVTDLLACVPHPVACSPHPFTGRTGGGTEPRRPLTGMARSPGTSALTLALGFASQCQLVAGGPLCLLGVTGARTRRGVVCSGMTGVPRLPWAAFPSRLGTWASRSGLGGRGSSQVVSSCSACGGTPCAPRTLSCPTCCFSPEPLLSCPPVTCRVSASGAASSVLSPF